MRDLEEQKFDFEWCCADELDSPDELKEILEFEVDEGMFEVLSTEEQSFLRGIGNKECIQTPLLFVSPPVSFHFFPFPFCPFHFCDFLRLWVAISSKLFSAGVVMFSC